MSMAFINRAEWGDVGDEFMFIINSMSFPVKDLNELLVTYPKFFIIHWDVVHLLFFRLCVCLVGLDLAFAINEAVSMFACSNRNMNT